MADHDAISEHIPEIEEEDPYEPLSAIQKNAGEKKDYVISLPWSSGMVISERILSGRSQLPCEVRKKEKRNGKSLK